MDNDSGKVKELEEFKLTKSEELEEFKKNKKLALQERKAAQHLDYLKSSLTQRTWYRYIVSYTIGLVFNIPIYLYFSSNGYHHELVELLVFCYPFVSLWLIYWFGKGKSKTLIGDRLKLFCKWLSYISVVLTSIVSLGYYNNVSKATNKIQENNHKDSKVIEQHANNTNKELQRKPSVNKTTDLPIAWSGNDTWRQKLNVYNWGNNGFAFARDNRLILNLKSKEMSTDDVNILKSQKFDCSVKLTNVDDLVYYSYRKSSYVTQKMYLIIPLDIKGNVKLDSIAPKYKTWKVSCKVGDKTYMSWVNYNNHPKL